MKETIIVYERAQVDVVERYIKKTTPSPRIITLDYWAERELIKRGIAVFPLTNYISPWTNFGDLLLGVENLAREWYRLPETKFLRHENIAIGEMIEASLYMYLQEARGYLYVFEQIFNKHSDIDRLILPHSGRGVSVTAGPFAYFQAQVVVDAGRFYTQHRGIAFETLGVTANKKTTLFPKQSFLKTAFLRAYNFLINRLVPRRTLHIYVSDCWENIKSIIEKMDDTELIFADRKELKCIPWRTLWKHRIRFMHPLDILTPEIRVLAKSKQKEFKSEWQKSKEAVRALPDFTCNDLNWWPLVEPALSFMVETYTERMVADIESIKKILRKENIQRVLVRASISGQHHLFILSKLPSSLGIPSMEIQHGIGPGTLHPHSVFGNFYTDYFISYGLIIQKYFVKNGYAKERVPPLGSPRIDRYFKERDTFTMKDRERKLLELGLDPKRPVILVIMVSENIGFPLGATDLTSYEFRDFLLSLLNVRKAIPASQFILKFRSPSQYEMYREYVEEMFPTEGITAQYGEVFSFVPLSDFVYSPFSTAAVECLMGRKPVILFPLKVGEKYFYEAHKDGTVTVPLLTAETRVPLQEVILVTRKLIYDKKFYTDSVERGKKYLSENFTFTGNAALRVADFLRKAPLPKGRN